MSEQKKDNKGEANKKEKSEKKEEEEVVVVGHGAAKALA